MEFEDMMDSMPKEKPAGAKGMCESCGQPLVGKIDISVKQADDSDDMKEQGEGYPMASDNPEFGDDDEGASDEKKRVVIAMLKKKQMEG